MAQAENLYRRVALINFSENGEHLVDIPRVQDINSIMVRVKGNLVISAAAATSVPSESPAGILKSVSFAANGKDVLDQIGFKEASLGNYARKFINHNTKPGATVATHPFEAVAYLDRDHVDGIRPKDSAFQAYLTNLLQLRIVTGQASDIVVKGGATLALSGVVIEVYVDSTNELSQDKGEAKFVKKVTSQSVKFTGANSNYRFRLPTSNHIRHVVLHVTDDDEPTNTLVDDIELVIDGVDVRHKAGFEATRLKNMKVKDLDSMPDGFAVIDSTPAGKLSNCYDLTDADLAEVVLDLQAPTGTGKVEMVTTEFIFPRVAGE